MHSLVDQEERGLGRNGSIIGVGWRETGGGTSACAGLPCPDEPLNEAYVGKLVRDDLEIMPGS